MTKGTTCYTVMLNPIAPNQWQGERECIVGPFTSYEIAEAFVSRVIMFRHQTPFQHHIFAKGDSWYVELIESSEAVVVREEVA